MSFGSTRNLELVQACSWTAGNIAGEDAARERDLMKCKWFDYRFMTPAQATEAFATAYLAVYRRKWSTYLSTEEAENKKAFRDGDWRSSRTERTSCWKARQAADLLGLPYHFFCEHALESALRTGWRKPPRPNQLYPLGNLGAVEAAWKEYCSGVEWMISALPQYHLDNFAALDAQYAHQDWVVDSIRQRHMKPTLIARACFELCVLPLDRAYLEFGPVRVNAALDYANDERLVPVTASTLTRGELRPSCFGILHSFSAHHPTCAECISNIDCAKVVASIRQHVIRECGHADPALARKRKLQAERTRNHRARKAGLLAAASS